jgi:hypothetical protein
MQSQPLLSSVLAPWAHFQNKPSASKTKLLLEDMD